MKSLAQIAESLEEEIPCTCHLHKWIPNRLTGHVDQCEVHRCALAIYRAKPTRRIVSHGSM